MSLPRLTLSVSQQNPVEVETEQVRSIEKTVLTNSLSPEDQIDLARLTLDRLDDAFVYFTALTGLNYSYFSASTSARFHSYWSLIFRVYLGSEPYDADFSAYCADFEKRVNTLLNIFLSNKGIAEKNFYPDTIKS